DFKSGAIGTDDDAGGEVVHMSSGDQSIDTIERVGSRRQPRIFEFAGDAVDTDGAAVVGMGLEAGLAAQRHKGAGGWIDAPPKHRVNRRRGAGGFSEANERHPLLLLTNMEAMVLSWRGALRQSERRRDGQ